MRGHAYGASLYERKQPGFSSSRQQPPFAAAGICHLCGNQGICLKLQPRPAGRTPPAQNRRDGGRPGPVKTEFFDIAETTGEIPLYKRLVMADPHKVVKLAICDCMAGKSVSVYGVWMKAFFVLCKVVPHEWILRAMQALNH